MKMPMEMIEMRQRAEFINQAGLTLVELLIVLGIFVCLITIANPHMGRISSGYRLRGAAREVATDLQYARLLAVKENKSFRVDFLSQSYQVVRVSDGSVVKNRNFSSDYPGITLSGSVVDFNSRGNSNIHTITVSNGMGSKTISVVPTGRVKLQ